MWVYKGLMVLLLNLGLFFLVKKIFPRLNKHVYCLTIITGLCIGLVIDYLVFQNADNLFTLWPLLIIGGMATFLLANYIFRR